VIENAIFMIEGGVALDLIQDHIAEKQVIADKIRELADEFCTTRVATSKFDGSLIGLHLDPSKPRPKDFTAPDVNGVSRPRSKSETAKRLRAIGGYKNPSESIAATLGIPTQLSYSKKGKFHGSRLIGHPAAPCGFLYISSNGPFAMWTPDVEMEVAAAESSEKGVVVSGPAKSFRMDIDGCRRLEIEEWEIIVRTHALIRKQAAGKLISQRRDQQAAKS
jgi:hypothetical protein